MNIQKFAYKNGIQLVGREVLQDTMKDIIVDAISALVIVIIGFFHNQKGKSKRMASREN